MSIINKRNTEKLNILLKQERKLFHVNDLRFLWSINNPATLRSTVSRYVKKGALIPIYRGFYSVLPIAKINAFDLGTSAIHSYCYVSTETVLAKAGIIFQKTYARTYCSSKTKTVKIGENIYKSRRLKDEYLYNPAGITDQANYKIASVERAVADMLYFNPKYYFDLKNAIDWKKVHEIQKEVGYNRGQLFRLIIEIADNVLLSKSLVFKGGTCAAMQGCLDRFSVDLDFDLSIGASKELVKKELESIFSDLGFEIKSQSSATVQYVLKYAGLGESRNTLKFDAVDFSLPENINQPIFLTDIDRYFNCQTIETMFSHKLVAVLDRYGKHEAVAGRDIYDIYHFFINGYRYNDAIIQKRTKLSAEQYIKKLIEFIEEKVTQTTINEDLNTLLPPEKFRAIRKSLKVEVLAMLKGEIVGVTG